jgi:hypothetical protein
VGESGVEIRRYGAHEQAAFASLVLLLFGRLLLRACRGRKKDCCNESCVLRPYCECSLAHDEASTRLENRLLVFVVICAVAVLAWAFS